MTHSSVCHDLVHMYGMIDLYMEGASGLEGQIGNTVCVRVCVCVCVCASVCVCVCVCVRYSFDLELH